MLVLVITVSFFVHLFSYSYMENDPHLPRFISYLSLFTFFMIILISSSNLIQLFIGWEGVGLCSYLLINFWYTRVQANKSAIKARMLNRVGDLGLSIGIFAIYAVFGSLDYSVVFSLVPAFLIMNFLFFLNLFQLSILLLFFFLWVPLVNQHK